MLLGNASQVSLLADMEYQVNLSQMAFINWENCRHLGRKLSWQYKVT